jgi:hypothetical protein
MADLSESSLQAFLRVAGVEELEQFNSQSRRFPKWPGLLKIIDLSPKS